MENFLRMTTQQKKAYTVAFVISARSVLAQAEDSAEQTSEEKVQQASQVDDILTTLMKSIQEPSADYMTVYIGMAIVLAFIGFFLYQALGLGKPKMHSQQLLLSDLDSTNQRSATQVEKDTAFKKKIDQNGPYAREPTGLLTEEATLKLRRQINEYAYLNFQKRRD